MEDPRYLPSLRSLARVAAAYGYRLSVEFQRAGRPQAKGTCEGAEARSRHKVRDHLREAGGPLRVVPVVAREGDGELLPHDDEADRDEGLGERSAQKQRRRGPSPPLFRRS